MSHFYFDHWFAQDKCNIRRQNVFFADSTFSSKKLSADSAKGDEATNRTTDTDETDSSRSENDARDWFGELRWNFLQKYIQYLQTLGFCTVHLLPSPKRYVSCSIIEDYPKMGDLTFM